MIPLKTSYGRHMTTHQRTNRLQLRICYLTQMKSTTNRDKYKLTNCLKRSWTTPPLSWLYICCNLKPPKGNCPKRIKYFGLVICSPQKTQSINKPPSQPHNYQYFRFIHYEKLQLLQDTFYLRVEK